MSVIDTDTDINTRRIQERVNSRREADQLMQLAADCTQHMTDDGRAAFWKRVRETVVEALPPEPAPVPRDAFVAMSDTEARLFEQRQMQFGIHKGCRISEVPLRYLDWLASRPQDNFLTDIARYLGNDSVSKLLSEAIERPEE